MQGRGASRAGLKTTALHHGMLYSRLSVSPILAQSCPVEKGGSTACVLWFHKRGLPASKQTLSRWIVDAIYIAYESSDLPSLLGVKAHSTRSVAASKVFLAGVPMQDICNTAGWSPPLTFVRFYDLDLQATPGFSVLFP